MKWMLISMMVTMMLPAQVTDQSAFEFLMSKETRFDRNFREVYNRELRRFLNLYPGSDHEIKVMKILADRLFIDESFHDAFALYVKIRFLSHMFEKTDVSTKIRQIINDHERWDFKTHGAHVLNVVNTYESAGRIDDHYQYLRLMHSLNMNEYYETVIQDAFSFLKYFPTSINTDYVTLMIAQTYQRRGDEKQALYYYKQLMFAVPKSNLMPRALYQTARLYQTEFNQFISAIQQYETLVQKYPADSLAAEGQYQIAMIYWDELDQPAKALDAMRWYVSQYPTGRHAVDLLLAMADVYAEQSEYESSVKMLKQVVSDYPDYRQNRDVQRRIIEVYQYRLKNNEKMAEELVRYVTLFPNDIRSPDNLYEAIRIFAGQLNQPARARDLIDRFKKSYSSDSLYDDVVNTERSLPTETASDTLTTDQ